jgi:transposase-like protein
MELRIPKNLIEFEEAYATEEQCLAALVQARWPGGFACPRCGGKKVWQLGYKRQIECTQCHYRTSPTAGTLFHGCKLSLKRLFRLIYLVMGEKDGMNHCAIKRQLGINRKTAQLWSRKIRDAICSREQKPLTGIVEVDETTIGGPAPGYFGRSLGENQSLVVILVEDDGGKCGRVRLEPSKSASGEVLGGFVEKHVEKGSTVRTDGWQAYNEATSADYKHVVKIAETPQDASKELPLVHRVASLLKRFILGTLHGAWDPVWLPWILEEFAFRFNRRNARYRPLLFNAVIDIGKSRKPPTRRQFQALYHILKEAA